MFYKSHTIVDQREQKETKRSFNHLRISRLACSSAHGACDVILMLISNVAVFRLLRCLYFKIFARGCLYVGLKNLPTWFGPNPNKTSQLLHCKHFHSVHFNYCLEHQIPQMKTLTGLSNASYLSPSFSIKTVPLLTDLKHPLLMLFQSYCVIQPRKLVCMKQQF